MALPDLSSRGDSETEPSRLSRLRSTRRPRGVTSSLTGRLLSPTSSPLPEGCQSPSLEGDVDGERRRLAGTLAPLRGALRTLLGDAAMRPAAVRRGRPSPESVVPASESLASPSSSSPSSSASSSDDGALAERPGARCRRARCATPAAGARRLCCPRPAFIDACGLRLPLPLPPLLPLALAVPLACSLSDADGDPSELVLSTAARLRFSPNLWPHE